MFYYKDSNGNYYSYKKEHLDLIPISEQEFKEHGNECITNDNDEYWGLINQLNYLKRQLSNSDYKAIKYAEGLISEEDYKPIKEERISIRSQIKEFEHVLDSLSS